MANVQGTTLNYFIYMCIAQASAVSVTICIDSHIFIVSFLNEMNYFATLGKLSTACLDYLLFEF